MPLQRVGIAWSAGCCVYLTRAQIGGEGALQADGNEFYPQREMIVDGKFLQHKGEREDNCTQGVPVPTQRAEKFDDIENSSSGNGKAYKHRDVKEYEIQRVEVTSPSK